MYANAAEAGAVSIGAAQQQIIGLRLGVAEEFSGTGQFRTLGRILADTSRVYRLTAKVDGWARKIYPVSTGTAQRAIAPDAASSCPPDSCLLLALYKQAITSISMSEFPGIPPAAAIVVRTGGSSPKLPS